MASTVKVKRSSVQDKVPLTTDLDLGEIAVNTYDGKMYIKKDDGTASVVEIGAIVENVSSTEADFNARAAENRDKFAGSGSIEWGNHSSYASYPNVNEGLWQVVLAGFENTLLLGINPTDTYRTGDSKTASPVVNVNGSIQHIKDIATTTGRNLLELPAASAVSTLTERQDLVFLETWHEKIADKDIVYPHGSIQSRLATDPSTGLTTVNGSFTGYATYSLFGNWQASSALIGKGLVWSTMTDANKKKFVSGADNNIYLAEDGELVQVRYRIRTVAGLGVDWIGGNLGINPQTAIYAGYGGTTQYLNAKGTETSITADLSAYDSNRAFLSSPLNTDALVKNEAGIFSVDETPYATLAYNGLCFAIPIALVSR